MEVIQEKLKIITPLNKNLGAISTFYLCMGAYDY